MTKLHLLYMELCCCLVVDSLKKITVLVIVGERRFDNLSGSHLQI